MCAPMTLEATAHDDLWSIGDMSLAICSHAKTLHYGKRTAPCIH